MRLLLDTHSFLWFVLDDPSLSPKAKFSIEDGDNELLISPANYWEIAIKIAAGKYQLNRPCEEFWKVGMSNNGIKFLPIEIRHTARLLILPFHHKDPFDRMLVAQALAEQIPLVSHDPALDAYGIERIW